MKTIKSCFPYYFCVHLAKNQKCSLNTSWYVFSVLCSNCVQSSMILGHLLHVDMPLFINKRYLSIPELFQDNFWHSKTNRLYLLRLIKSTKTHPKLSSSNHSSPLKTPLHSLTFQLKQNIASYNDYIVVCT